MTLRYHVFSLLLLALASSPVFAADDESADALVAGGNALYAAGDYTAATQKYQAALRLQPDDAAIHFDLGDAYYQRQLYADALTHYEKALQTAGPELEARLRYNLGNAEYQQALEALNTLQDALTPARAAMAYYRDSLALEPERADTRYNLEMSLRLLREIERRQVQPQANPRARNQKTSSNTGQAFNQEAQYNRPAESGAEQDEQQDTSGREAAQAPNKAIKAENKVQTQQAATPQEISPEDAERMVDILRQRAQAARNQRQQWRNARMRDARVERIW